MSVCVCCCCFWVFFVFVFFWGGGGGGITLYKRFREVVTVVAFYTVFSKLDISVYSPLINLSPGLEHRSQLHASMASFFCAS